MQLFSIEVSKVKHTEVTSTRKNWEVQEDGFCNRATLLKNEVPYSNKTHLAETSPRWVFKERKLKSSTFNEYVCAFPGVHSNHTGELVSLLIR